MSDYACGEKRNKKKDKLHEKKKNPYKTGGKFRSSGVVEVKSKSSKIIKVKKKMKKKK